MQHYNAFEQRNSLNVDSEVPTGDDKKSPKSEVGADEMNDPISYHAYSTQMLEDNAGSASVSRKGSRKWGRGTTTSPKDSPSTTARRHPVDGVPQFAKHQLRHSHQHHHGQVVQQPGMVMMDTGKNSYMMRESMNNEQYHHQGVINHMNH